MKSQKIRNRMMQILVEDECKPRQVRFWGQHYQIAPASVEQVFGDGMKLIGLAPLNTRPNYYVIRIDSSWDLDASDEFLDHLEEIYDAIENEYGARRTCYCDPENDECEKCREWPAFCDEGSSWFEL